MYLYLLTNTAHEPQKLYVGITSRPVNRRLMEHFNTASKKTTLIARALHKYGSDAFTLTVLGKADSWEELCAMEQAAIVQYNTFVPHGYNLTRGGDGTLGWKHSPEAIELMRQANLGRVMPQSMRDAVGARMRGVPKSPEQRAKMGEWQRGENNNQYGKKLEPEHLAKMLAGIAKIREETGDPRKGRPISDEHKASLSQSLKGRTYTEAERTAHEAQYDAMRGQSKSEETRAKISAKTREQFARQGNPMLGRKHSAETKAKIAAKRRGKPGGNKGKKLGPLSDETKAKLSAALQGRPAWNEGIPWHDITGGKEHPKARAVEYDGVVYPSVMACHVQTGLARNTIRLYIKQGKARYM